MTSAITVEPPHPGTESSLDSRWREMDSNFQYAGALNLVVAPFMPPKARDGSVTPKALAFSTLRIIALIHAGLVKRSAIGFIPRPIHGTEDLGEDLAASVDANCAGRRGRGSFALSSFRTARGPASKRRGPEPPRPRSVPATHGAEFCLVREGKRQRPTG